ncbi:PAS domain-containing protein [Persicitalea sp.]|uniref:PAS domain-containing sensor histidine kinase n=1 Tax=Persicitalea sp. TaxID=3100273 RepID=UPI0035946C5A
MPSNDTVTNSVEHAFLRGGGEMGQRTRTMDWSQTQLGTPDTWPQGLRTTLGILLNSRFPMFLFWGKDLLCFYNDAYRPSLGNDGKHPHALGQPATEIWTEIWDIIKPLLDQVRLTGEATWSEDQLIPFYRNGRIEDVYWTFSYSPIFDESGQVVAVLTTCTETTEKVNNLKKLTDSKNQLHFAIEAAELGTWDYNPLTEKFTGSVRFKEWFGIPADQGATLEEGLATVIDEDRARVEAAFRQAMEYKSGGEYLIEYTIANQKTGTKRNVLAKGRAWFNEQKVAYRINGTVQDITKAVLAREKIQAEKTRFQTLLETIPNIAWHTDPGGKLTFINQRWYDYTGQSVEETFNGGWEVATHSDDLPAATEKMRHSLKTGKAYEVEYRLRRADGAYRWHLARATAMRDEAGEIASWLGTITDIHEQKQTQIHLDELVAQRTRQLEVSVQELRRSNENLQQFAYVASHDLQEPLRKIQSFGDMLKKRYEAQLGDGADYLNRMQTAARRMSVLIDDLLTYSRITTRQEAADEVPLEKVMSSVLNNLELRIMESQASITMEPLPVVQGDASQLNQLFQNLLSNAMKFKKSNIAPVIRIVTTEVSAADVPADVRLGRQAAAYYRIDIADNGVGFEEKYLDRIFEVFQRLHGKSQYSGTGIGLAICEKVAVNHGGAITATSQLGKGTTFSVYLPV